MALLVLGLLLWSFGHMARRAFPGFAQAMGPAALPAMIAVATLGTAMMVIGYRDWFGEFYWGRTPALTGINNLLMLVAVYLFAAAGMKTWVARHLRNPMMIGVLIWSVAHLLVNGDTPSFVLFGGIGLWALAQIAVINRTAWVPPVAKDGAGREIMAVIGTVIVYGAIAGVHYALGYPTFG
ncbi:NnrU family protein [Paenirhodobacter sp.]|uniref:NnrU family protein n=1 Tax=Paenirhodobacter sp. TaxID=1965326 RepID=UPI003B3C25F6